MSSRTPRYRVSAPPKPRAGRAKSSRLRCDELEGRITPTILTVQPPLTYTSASLDNNGCVISCDLNKDGLPDIVLTNFGQDFGATLGTKITILKGATGGGFESPTTLATSGSNASFVTVGDLDGDTWPDLLVTNENNQGTGTVSVFKNDGAGGMSLFGSPFSTFGTNPSWVGMADVDGDGTLDAVVSNFGKADPIAETVSGNKVTIFHGNGDCTFAGNAMTTLAPEIQFVPIALAVADFNGDGFTDIVAISPGIPTSYGTNYPPGTLYQFKGMGGGSFADPNTSDTGGTFPVNIQVGYLNGDGKLDLAIANAGDVNGSWTGTSVATVLNTSTASSLAFGGTNNITTNCYGTFGVAIADLDLDGRGDVAAINYGSYPGSGTAPFVSIYTGNGSGAFTPSAPTYDTQVGGGKGGQYLAVGDFNADGTPDLVVAHANVPKIGLLTNNSVAPVSTTTAIQSNLNPATVGVTVTFTATVTPASGTVSGGTVQFFKNGSPMGSPVALTGGQAQFPTSTLAVGTYSITATYSGASGFGGSTTGTPVSQVINPAVPAPIVTISPAAGQASPTGNSPIKFDVHFDQAVTGFDGTDISFAGSTVGGSPSASVTGASPGQDFVVSVSGMTGSGDVKASVKANAAINSSSVSNTLAAGPATVVFDGSPPTVTINQAVGQADPTSVASVKFDVKFGKPVTGFDLTDVSLAGSTAGGSLTINVSGSGDTYVVTVAGMTSRGFVIASIPAGVAPVGGNPGSGAFDSLGNPNAASTSSDHSIEYLDTGVVGFTQTVFGPAAGIDEEGSLAARTVTVTLTRTGLAEGQVTVHFATSDNTAHTTGTGAVGLARGQIDYETKSQDLTWADGVGGDKTITFLILPDALNEGRETINLSLTAVVVPGNPAPGLGQTSAQVAIAPSDGDGAGKFVDTDGDKATVKLSGNGLDMKVFRTDPDGLKQGPIELIQLTDKNPLPPTVKPSTLTITVAKAKTTTTDGGTIAVGAITGSSLKNIAARKANLNLDGVLLSGYLGSLTIGNITGGADIKTGASTNLKLKTKINALAIGDGTTIDIGGTLGNLTATSFGASSGASSIKAPTVGTINIKGNMYGDVDVTGVGVDPTKKALGVLKVKGIAIGSDIMVNGNIGSVTVGAFRDSHLWAGYAGPQNDGTGAWNTTSATVTSFKVTGKTLGFQNSQVIAAGVVSASLASVDSNAANMGDPLGFYVKNSVGRLTIGGPEKHTYLAADGLYVLPRDFVVVKV